MPKLVMYLELLLSDTYTTGVKIVVIAIYRHDIIIGRNVRFVR